MAVYHHTAPRIKIRKRLYNYPFILNTNDHISFLVSPRNWEPEVKEIMTQPWGTVWDVGANFGLFSILTAKAGNTVIAFDPSHAAIDQLEESRRINNCSNLRTVPKPLSVRTIQYKKPKTASCTNSVYEVDKGHVSITYKDAEKEYGIPNFIKMDIEGDEKQFLEDSDFLEWIKQHSITLLIEIHGAYKPTLILQDSQFRESAITKRHLLYTIAG